MIRSSHDTMMARSSSGSGATRVLVWPCPGKLGKAWFVLHDGEEVKLWHLLGERGLSMESDLALTKARLKEALERVESSGHDSRPVTHCRGKFSMFLVLSLAPWAFNSCLSMLASCLIGSGDDVDP